MRKTTERAAEWTASVVRGARLRPPGAEHDWRTRAAAAATNAKPRLITEERERERESLTHLTNTSNVDNFSLIFYIYRKIPEPDPDRFYRLSSLVDYPFFYPFFARRLLFSQEYTVVIENKNFSEKFSFFSAAFLFVLRTELPLTMLPPAWSAGVFCIYGSVLFPPAPDDLPRIRAPPLAARTPGRRRKPPRRCFHGYA